MALVWQVLHEDPACPSRVVLEKVAQRQVPIAVSVRPLHRLRVKWNLNRRQGRPGQTALSRPVGSGGAVVQVTARLSGVGVHLFAHGLAQHDGFAPVVAGLQQAIAAHKSAQPDDDFALRHHREQPLRRRFQALFFAPLLGSDTLTGVDTHAHPLQTLLGQGYQRATLTPCLGQLERSEAARALMPALVPEHAGQLAYVDGHLIASGSRVPMPKGKSTMRGRLMAGSPAVIAHNEAGQALFVADYPPAIHVSQVGVDYGHKVVEATGSSRFVIDRAVNAVAMACAFDTQGWGRLWMLDDNEHDGLDSCDAPLVGTLEDGTRVYSGPWKVPRQEAPSHFVIVEPAAGTPLVYGGTPKVRDTLAVREWPQGYQERSERQEHSFQRMLDHGALKTNYGRKKLVGPDRHPQRQKEQLDQALEAAKQRVDKKAEALTGQQAQVAESAAKGHGKRLEQRQRTCAVLDQALKEAQHKHARLAEQASALGPPGTRADRDVRTQTIMTVRTLLLENALMSFLAVRLGHLQTTVSLACLLTLLFERSGARVETLSHVMYWVNTAGLSVPYRRLLAEVVDGLGAMDLRAQGKPMHVRLRDMPL
jgi:hypothetical protein